MEIWKKSKPDAAKQLAFLKSAVKNTLGSSNSFISAKNLPTSFVNIDDTTRESVNESK